MKTEAQVARDARKRRKAREKKRGIAPHTWELSITTYIWDGWHDCGACEGGSLKDLVSHCWEDPTYHCFWQGTCIDNMMQNHFRSIHSGWIVNSGHEVSSHVIDYLEAHGESVRHHKAYLQSRQNSAKINLSWNVGKGRKVAVVTADGQGCFIRSELLVRCHDTPTLGGHVWQGIGDLGIGPADVAAVLLQ